MLIVFRCARSSDGENERAMQRVTQCCAVAGVHVLLMAFVHAQSPGGAASRIGQTNCIDVHDAAANADDGPQVRLVAIFRALVSRLVQRNDGFQKPKESQAERVQGLVDRSADWLTH